MRKRRGGNSIVFKDKTLFDFLQYELYSPSLYGETFLNGIFTNRYKFNLKVLSDAEKNRGYMLIGNLDGFYQKTWPTDINSFNCDGLMDIYFRKIIELCDTSNIQFIYQAAPINKASYENLSPRLIEEYNGYMEQIQNDYPKADINGELFWYDNMFFGDQYLHFNKRGAKKFSREMKEKYNYIFDK